MIFSLTGSFFTRFRSPLDTQSNRIQTGIRYHAAQTAHSRLLFFITVFGSPNPTYSIPVAHRSRICSQINRARNLFPCFSVPCPAFLLYGTETHGFACLFHVTVLSSRCIPPPESAQIPEKSRAAPEPDIERLYRPHPRSWPDFPARQSFPERESVRTFCLSCVTRQDVCKSQLYHRPPFPAFCRKPGPIHRNRSLFHEHQS